ncbi:ABC transporter ATP-binding protein [Paenibacillus turpanensis]|uniref:ABC transporter ATP-binding protein n=1 Tax=Paenibacillus turpanensis TaxID=2689078 RepID=UPI001408C356|nr:ABC transporter ATP-binding protein [Paenibacillus turpanensis]
MTALEAKQLTLGYGEQLIIDNLDLRIPTGQITVFIGSNGSGKSTLLRSMARLLKPISGSVLLNGKDIRDLPTKQIAKQLAILPQTPTAPEGLTVYSLVKQGRYPHQNMFHIWTKEDEQHVQNALQATRLTQFADRPVDSLSGGQRQRAWIAMTLAQNCPIVLLDEPTTYLDLSHQIDVLDLLYDLNEQQQRTIVMVLHDINLACRYAHHIVAVKNKTVVAQGKPEDIITSELLREVFDLECTIVNDPLSNTPMCVPSCRGRCFRPLS